MTNVNWPTTRFGAAATTLAASLAVAVSSSVLQAQNPVQASFVSCPVSAHVYSGREAQVAAKPVVDSAMTLRPVVGDSAEANIAFTVDTLGIPEAQSLVRLRLPDPLLWSRVEAAYRRWRFQPAMASGCKVRQRVVATVLTATDR